jgi:large subunit ribosomal protein L30
MSTVKVKVTQVKSLIDRTKRDKATMKALGLGRINRSVVRTATPQFMGMVRAVSHLIRVEEVKD